MARSYRFGDGFREQRERIADRAQSRADRRREFEAMGLDEADAYAAPPPKGREAERARQMFRRG